MIDEPDPNPNQELRLQPGWWARLDGETFELEALAGVLGRRSRVQVCQFDGRYYMKMAEFDQLNESGDVETRAGEVLRIVNGLLASSTATTMRFGLTRPRGFSPTGRSSTSST
ncbi:MAG: hypothetical protein M3546_14590 [Actinomycetota bacterium]|nr:hypothetical protein [Actinomycetota bacterium]